MRRNNCSTYNNTADSRYGSRLVLKFVAVLESAIADTGDTLMSAVINSQTLKYFIFGTL